uniref:Uncharacterized protein n=1 Tax=viral metagenome TaxID=1070528 RepID=A0A6C0KPV1_9ZZZZ
MTITFRISECKEDDGYGDDRVVIRDVGEGTYPHDGGDEGTNPHNTGDGEDLVEVEDLGQFLEDVYDGTSKSGLKADWTITGADKIFAESPEPTESESQLDISVTPNIINGQLVLEIKFNDGEEFQIPIQINAAGIIFGQRNMSYQLTPMTTQWTGNISIKFTGPEMNSKKFNYTFFVEFNPNSKSVSVIGLPLLNNGIGYPFISINRLLGKISLSSIAKYAKAKIAFQNVFTLIDAEKQLWFEKTQEDVSEKLGLVVGAVDLAMTSFKEALTKINPFTDKDLIKGLYPI